MKRHQCKFVLRRMPYRQRGKWIVPVACECGRHVVEIDGTLMGVESWDLVMGA